MEERVARVYRFKKVLKYSILSLVLAIVGILIFEYFRVKPNNVYFTNITSSSVTVSWDTKIKTDATAIYVEPENKLPFLILPIFKEKFFDTRDMTKAELEAAQQSSNNQEGLEVTMDELVTNISVSERGRYYTHHVEIKGLDPEKEYSFMVGDSIVFRKAKDVNNETIAKTLVIPESISTPSPIYGSVKDANNEDKPLDELQSINDGVIYANYIDKISGEKSNIYSSALNIDGNWYIDISNAVDDEGNDFLATYIQSDVYLEFTLDSGPLGKWRVLNNLEFTAPTEPFVINMKDATDNENVPGSVVRLDSMSNTLIKNIYAIPIIDGVEEEEEGDDNNVCGDGNEPTIGWDKWCGPCSYRCKDGTKISDEKCDETKLGERGCSDAELEEAGQEITSTGYQTGLLKLKCVGGEHIGDVVMVNGVCKECILYGSGNGGYAKYTNRDNNDCKRAEQIAQEEAALEDERTNHSITVRKPIANGGGGADAECEEGEVRNSYNECVRETIGRSQGEHIPPPETYPNAGHTCTNNAGIAYGIYDANGECVPRTTDQNLLEPDIAELNCWRYGSTTKLDIYYNGTRYRCTRQNTLKKANTDRKLDFECTEGELCTNTKAVCINLSDGRELFCNANLNILQNGDPLFKWTFTGESDLIGIGSTQPVNIEKGKPCGDDASGGCKCPTVAGIILPGQTCPEVEQCTKINQEGRICNTYGEKCENKRVDGIATPQCGDTPRNSQVFDNTFNLFRPKLFAQEESSSITGEKYIIDQSTGTISGIEEGVYSFENNGEEYMFIVSKAASKDDSVVIFIDINNNGVLDEGTDKKLSEFGSEITIQTLKKTYTYNLKEGFNFISFPFINENEKARTASGMLTMLNDFTNGTIYSISKFDGSWKIVGQNGEKYENNDFQLIPGQGYVVKSTKDVEVRISGYPVNYEVTEDSAPISLFPGWNLIGLYGTKVKSYTAKSMIQDINAFETVDFTADNVSKWESDIQRYEGYQLTNENGIDLEYGFDYPLNILQSYFVRVNQGTGNWQPKLAE